VAAECELGAIDQRGARSHLAPLRRPGPRNAQAGPPACAGRTCTPVPGCRVAASGEWAL